MKVVVACGRLSRCPTGRTAGHVLADDRRLERPELLAELETQLVAEQGPRPLVGGQRVGLASRPVEREHQVAPQALAVRMRGHEGVELVDQARGLSQLERSRLAVLAGCQMQLLESLGPDPEVAVVGMTGQGRAAPQRQGGAEPLVRRSGVAPGEGLPAVADESFEAVGVERVGLDVEDVATRTAADRRIVAEHRSEARDVGAQGGRRSVGRLAGPELVDQVVRRDDAAPGEHQVGEEGLLAAPAESEEPAIASRLDAAEQVKLERSGGVSLTARAHAGTFSEPEPGVHPFLIPVAAPRRSRSQTSTG